jgi:serine/threonine protein kinase
MQQSETSSIGIGAVLDSTYRLERLVGTGGMGAVYEAVHTRLGEKRFAVKMLHPAIAQDAEVFRRFRQEAMVVFWKQLADGIRKVPRLLGGKEVD